MNWGNITAFFQKMVLSPIRISLQEQTCTTAWETKPGLSSKRIVSGAWGRFQGLNLTQRFCWRVARRSLGYYIMSQKVCLSVYFSRSVCWDLVLYFSVCLRTCVLLSMSICLPVCFHLSFFCLYMWLCLFAVYLCRCLFAVCLCRCLFAVCLCRRLFAVCLCRCLFAVCLCRCLFAVNHCRCDNRMLKPNHKLTLLLSFYLSVSTCFFFSLPVCVSVSLSVSPCLTLSGFLSSSLFSLPLFLPPPHPLFLSVTVRFLLLFLKRRRSSALFQPHSNRHGVICPKNASSSACSQLESTDACDKIKWRRAAMNCNPATFEARLWINKKMSVLKCDWSDRQNSMTAFGCKLFEWRWHLLELPLSRCTNWFSGNKVGRNQDGDAETNRNTSRAIFAVTSVFVFQLASIYFINTKFCMN